MLAGSIAGLTLYDAFGVSRYTRSVLDSAISV